jgi:diaminopimelate epimerase
MFWKYEGLGNDFLLFRAREASAEEITAEQRDQCESFDSRRDFTPSVVRRICHRSTGIGADGIIVLSRDHLVSPQYRIKIFNSDGSCAKMCGNGVRCVAQFIFDTEWKSNEPFLTEILTDAGTVSASVRFTCLSLLIALDLR